MISNLQLLQEPPFTFYHFPVHLPTAATIILNKATSWVPRCSKPAGNTQTPQPSAQDLCGSQFQPHLLLSTHRSTVLIQGQYFTRRCSKMLGDIFTCLDDLWSQRTFHRQGLRIQSVQQHRLNCLVKIPIAPQMRLVVYKHIIFRHVVPSFQNLLVLPPSKIILSLDDSIQTLLLPKALADFITMYTSSHGR